MTNVIANLDEVSPEWLTNILRQDGCLRQGKVVSIHSTSEPSYTSTIAKLKVAYSDDTSPSAPTRFFLKLSRPDAKQRVVGSTQRRKEVTFHNKVAPFMTEPPIAHCYHAVYCVETGTSHLLFDDLSESHTEGESWNTPKVELSEKTMDAFAQIHAFWWDHPALRSFEALPNQKSVSNYITDTRECYPKFADALGDRLTLPQHHIYEQVVTALPRLWQRVLHGDNLTLIHGDANFSNVLLPRNPCKEKALIIDWQLWGISFAAEDLAHLIALYWDKESRKKMEKPLLICYHRELIHHGVRNYTWHDCWNDYRLAVILRVLFMPMWFWLSGAQESHWQRSLVRAMQAIEDLECREFYSV